ncbi:hypothetical protein MUA01_12295 [Enterobacteriaceae bacterium H18W14]|uniref:hypothetical protein n=1 Tax=Dryocola boscaweniae TaxID=2925397 RepID=UPI0022F12F45|nr:hypothetical protein [Dryocola boscaweniae]MCT4715745.1 hypothetical protein [Dryocola boscaweniae]
MVKKECGLPEGYYLNKIIVAIVIAAIWLLFKVSTGSKITGYMMAFSGISVLLYPYSRFLYEKIISYVVADNKLYFPVVVFIVVKLITMCLCWFFSFLIAPVGLAYLFYSRPMFDSSHSDGQP